MSEMCECGHPRVDHAGEEYNEFLACYQDCSCGGFKLSIVVELKGPYDEKDGYSGDLIGPEADRIQRTAREYERLNIAWHSRDKEVEELRTVLGQFVRAVRYTSGVSLDFAVLEAEKILSKVKK